MAAKLGSGEVSFRLGSATPAAVYLGSEQVWTAGRTLYFNGGLSDAWTALGSWSDDAGPAASLPTAADSVVAYTRIVASGQTVANFTLEDMNADYWELVGTLTVTGMATFNGGAINAAAITGNATFNDSSSNHGSVSGTATFNDSSCNSPSGTAGTFVPNPPPSC